MKTFTTVGLFIAVAGVAGCVSASAPPELVSARTAYDRASHGTTADVNPTDLHTAKESLDVAEKSFADDGDTQETRDLGYRGAFCSRRAKPTSCPPPRRS